MSHSQRHVLQVEQATVALYKPLFLPLGLELGGFIFLAFGLAPTRRDTMEEATEEAAPAKPRPKAGTREWYLARLERFHPQTAKRVHKGELSVYRASIKAGLRKEATWRKWDAADNLQIAHA